MARMRRRRRPRAFLCATNIDIVQLVWCMSVKETFRTDGVAVMGYGDGEGAYAVNREVTALPRHERYNRRGMPRTQAQIRHTFILTRLVCSKTAVAELWATNSLVNLPLFWIENYNENWARNQFISVKTDTKL